jgi:hypothetical protein
MSAARLGTTKETDLIQSSADFTVDFVPPDYLIFGLLRRRFLYSFTAKSGDGKTAIMLVLVALIGLGRRMTDREVEAGKVLYLSGENPDDVAMGWIAMAQRMDFDLSEINVHFVPGRFKISEMREGIGEEIKAKMGEVALVIVDTSAAYFEGDDENNNTQAGDWARFLRTLAELPGEPCVLIACHPVKNAADDNLLPRSGGAFLNEVDGNLTAKRSDTAVELHWQGKFRGRDFAPIPFLLRGGITHERLKDTKGRLLPTVIAELLSETAEEQMTIAARSQEDALLKVLAKNPGASTAELAKLLDWKMSDGKPYKVLVRRKLASLVKGKLITKERDSYALTPKGKKVLTKISGRLDNDDEQSK